MADAHDALQRDDLPAFDRSVRSYRSPLCWPPSGMPGHAGPRTMGAATSLL